MIMETCFIIFGCISLLPGLVIYKLLMIFLVSWSREKIIVNFFT